MFTQRSRDDITVTWKTRHFRHFTSEHYKVSKSEVLGKVVCSRFLNVCWWHVPKNCKNWSTCVKPIASQTLDIFWDTVYCRPLVRAGCSAVHCVARVVYFGLPALSVVSTTRARLCRRLYWSTIFDYTVHQQSLEIFCTRRDRFSAFRTECLKPPATWEARWIWFERQRA